MFYKIKTNNSEKIVYNYVKYLRMYFYLSLKYFKINKIKKN